MKPSSVDLDELVTQVERRVLARIAAALTSAALPTAYTTRRGNGPPGWPDERWKAVAPTIPGATKPGRWTIVPRAAFEAWQLAQSDTGPLPARAANDDLDEGWTPRAALLAAGLRPTRRA